MGLHQELSAMADAAGEQARRVSMEEGDATYRTGFAQGREEGLREAAALAHKRETAGEGEAGT
ncbi:hypothetical protein [Mycobacteroides chelonae]|uniref:hypothetical protein n=1 Tax=Mycobacteroides chelonae TaxID=1774 RepID=UPI0008A96242|nr:hypothetical protein [Mycobacteroides chelonae]OHU12883.1 hypothetical protein BKG75_17885 [Mycobacteroides chelonae]